MSMRKKIARLFTIKTRTEALLVTYAIAVGAIERGATYMDNYPGYAGMVLALACLGVPFIAGAKLIDSVKPQLVPAAATGAASRRHLASRINRNRPIPGRIDRGSASRASRRKDLPRAR